MADVNQNRSIIILNVYKLNNPIKRQRLPDWIKKKKTRSSYMLYVGDTL